MEQSLEWNEANLKRMASLENSCRVLYEKIDGMYGEEYAEFILTRILKQDFTVTQFGQYPLKEYKSLSKRVLLVQHLHNGGPKSFTEFTYTLITFYTAVIRDLLSCAKTHASIELYDFFICLGLMIEKWRITEYPKYITKRKDDVETLLKQFVKLVVNALYCYPTDIQNITLSILDKRLFDDMVVNGNYTVMLDRKAETYLKADYDMYLSGIRMFFDILKGTQPVNMYVQPAIRTYAVASSKLKAEFLECVEKETGIDIGVIFDIFKNVNFDANPQWLNSPEYKEAFNHLEELTSNKKCNMANLKWRLGEIFGTDYITYLNVCCKKLAYFLKEYELEKNVTSYETVYYKYFQFYIRY